MKKINNQWYTDKQYIEILEKKIKELEETNKLMLINDDELLKTNTINKSEVNKLQQRIDKAIELLEEDYFEDGSGNNVEEVIRILKGEENESN